jgi:glycosyltransferase involved in cell wall biosynthesis
MKISYAITVCNELNEIQQLVDFLLTHKRSEDEIVILMDHNGTEEVWNYLLTIESKLGILNRIPFNKNFSKFKNHLNSLCSGDYIFNIDADEIPSENLINNIHELIELNPEVLLYAIPRVNTVEGLTQEHIQKWRWNIDDRGFINYPDYQCRIYKNDHGIFWEGKVHERLNIWDNAIPFPHDTLDWVLYHHKQISRQEKQNKLYEQI